MYVGDSVLDGPPWYGALFTSATAIKNYLPAGGTPSTLTADLTDPLSTSAGVFGGQATALSLNVGFSCTDACGPIFETLGLEANTTFCLGELVVCDGGKFDGLTVYQLLDLCNTVISGDLYALMPYGASISELSDAAAFVNQNFVGGEVNNGYLCLP
jgi:hypothetical protein